MGFIKSRNSHTRCSATKSVNSPHLLKSFSKIHLAEHRVISAVN